MESVSEGKLFELTIAAIDLWKFSLVYHLLISGFHGIELLEPELTPPPPPTLNMHHPGGGSGSSSWVSEYLRIAGNTGVNIRLDRVHHG